MNKDFKNMFFDSKANLGREVGRYEATRYFVNKWGLNTIRTEPETTRFIIENYLAENNEQALKFIDTIKSNIGMLPSIGIFKKKDLVFEKLQNESGKVAYLLTLEPRQYTDPY